MRMPVAFTLAAAAAGVILVFIVGGLILRPPLPLILAAGFDRAAISPNADGEDDIAVFSYALARPAVVSSVADKRGGQDLLFPTRSAARR